MGNLEITPTCTHTHIQTFMHTNTQLTQFAKLFLEKSGGPGVGRLERGKEWMQVLHGWMQVFEDSMQVVCGWFKVMASCTQMVTPDEKIVSAASETMKIRMD